MNFEGDAFISYAHLDNVELVEGRKGWVANLQRALQIRLAQLLGKPTEIWWDPKLQGNDVFSETLIEKLRAVAALVSVVTPRYVKSEWGLRELTAFVCAATERNCLQVGDKCRIFKVLKTPVPLDEHPPELRPLLGYEFYRTDPETGKVRELNEVFGPDAQRDFWLKLDDLAHDMCRLLERLERLGDDTCEMPADDAAIFLAETTADLREAREAIKRDLQQHGHTVLPAQALPLSVAELESVVAADLSRCRMSIHLVGRNYGFVPEGGVRSVVEIQNDLAARRAAEGGLTRLIWLPERLAIRDERQVAVVQQLRMDPRVHPGGDLLESPLEDLKTLIADRLSRPAASVAGRDAPSSESAAQLYLIYDQRDRDNVFPWQQFFHERGVEVLHPLFEGDEAEVRQYHEENLRICDGALVIHGAAGESWLRRKLRELQKSAGFGRTKPYPVVAICLVPPKTLDKERFQTHDALLIPQWNGFAAEPLHPLVARLTTARR